MITHPSLPPIRSMTIILEPATVAAIRAEYPSFIASRDTVQDLVNASLITLMKEVRDARRLRDEYTPVLGLSD